MRTVDRKFQNWAWLTAISVGWCAAFSLPSQAMTEKDYLQALSLAQAKVQRTRRTNSALALSSPIIKAFFGRYYRVGDSWDVAAWEIKNPLMSLAPIPEGQPPKTGRAGIFHYEVKEVRNGASPSVVISVSQLTDLGMSPVDVHVEELFLTMSDQFVQTEKAYRFRGRPDLVKVSPDGLRSRITPLELFALDVPEIATAVHNTPSAMPALPLTVQALAQRVGFQPRLEQSTWLEQDDFFGRPVQILWQYGNPWPSYLKTDDGISILIRSKTEGSAS